MEKYELDKLRDLPIVGVAERLGLHVSRRKCLCPFHEDHHASMSFNVSRNICRCFVCMNESIGTIDLVMRILGKTFKEACDWLAKEYNIILDFRMADETSAPTPSAEVVKPFDASRYERFFVSPWLSRKAKEFLFGERKIDPRVVRWCRLTSWQDRHGTDWLQIPYYDQKGKLIGVQNRNLNYGQNDSDSHSDGKQPTPRFRFPVGSSCAIYNLPVLAMLKPHEPLYITEGASDCWAMLSAGHKAIAIPSATLLKPSHRQLLTSLADTQATEFHMFPDRDAPGELLFLKLRHLLPGLVHHQLPDGCKDYSDFYLKNNNNLQL